MTDVDIRKTIESSLALLGPNKRQVEISFRTIPGMPAVRADSLQLQQVLLNLMLNAIDAMEQNKGEQRLTLFAGPATEAPLPFSPPADHPGARPEDYIFIQVADNGCGMDHATMEKAFEPFFTTKPVGRGTGMGLAMVYGTVSHHQGWIQLESTPEPVRTSAFSCPAPARRIRKRNHKMPPLEVVSQHHEVLRAWCRHRRTVETPPVAVTFDHHTDTLPAFSRAASSEAERESWIAEFDWRSDASVEAALRRLRHDEHLDLALRGGVISRSIVIAHSTENVITESLNPRIRVAADATWPELNCLLNHPEEFRPRASGSSRATFWRSVSPKRNSIPKIRRDFSSTSTSTIC